MPRVEKLTKRYTVTLPDVGTPAWQQVVDAFMKGDPSYAEDLENMEPNVLDGNIAYWLASDLTFAEHPELRGYVDLEDYILD